MSSGYKLNSDSQYRSRKSLGILKPALAFSLLSVLMGSATLANAACKGIDCVCRPSELQFASPTTKPNEEGKYPISLEADDVESQGEELVTLIGNAEVSQGRQTIVADKVQFYRETERVVAEGNVEVISENGDYLSSDSIDVHAPTQIGTLSNAKFKLAGAMTSTNGIDTVAINSRGEANTVGLEGEGLVRMNKGLYTTCPEGNNSVLIGAREIELDQIAGVGKARGATVRFQGVPIFYAPYISFPLNDDRKTGFLTPGFGSDDESGSIIEFPWYWNIAKNQDATITPRFYTDRGVQVGAEYRHRSLNSTTYVYGEFLPSDSLVEDENLLREPDDQIESDRSLFTFQHFQQFTDTVSGSVNFNDVSDIDYFDDLSNDVRLFSASFVPRDAQLNYAGRYVRVGVRANEYQIIDDIIPTASAPLERLPSVTLSTNLPDGPYGLRYGLNASFINFNAASNERIDGTRTALTPFVQLPIENLWGYVKPKISLNTRSYSLNNVEEGAEDSPSFTVPIFSVDSGLYFEKNINWFGEGALQTLEPRLYYVFAPDEDQSDVPVFDTSEIVLNNISNIYRETRFFGEDRVGDTNQVTLGLTSRIIDNETGDQRVVASLGQLILLDDLELRLNDSSPVIESGLGDLLAEVRTESQGPWSTYSFLQFDHDESELTTASFAVGYQPKDDNRKNVQVGYRRTQGFTRVIDQLTIDANWPISDRWQFFGSERFSIEDSESLSTTLGLEYNACCWKLRFVGTDRLNNRNIDDKKTSFFVELELTSLGSFKSGF